MLQVRRAPFVSLNMWLGLALGLVGSCSEQSVKQGPDTRREVLENLALEVALPTYQDFAAQTKALTQAGIAFCDEPDDDGLEKTRNAWQDARAIWKQAEVFAYAPYGPYAQDPLRLGPKIDFWPAREDTLNDVLSGDEQLDEKLVSGLGTAGRGLPAIEYLLYGENQAGDAGLSAFTAEEGGARRCAYLTALAADLETNASAMAEAWDPEGGGFAAEIYNAGDSSETFDSLSAAVNETFNRMIFTLEDIRQLKLGKPAGKDGGEPDPNTAESRFSGRSADDMVDALNGMLAAYRGERSEEEGPGFEEQVRNLDADLDARFQKEAANAIEALKAIPGPLTAAVNEHPDEVEAAYQAVKTAHVTLGAEVAGLLGITVTFNNTDAD